MISTRHIPMRLAAVALLSLLMGIAPAGAREAAFVEPGTTSGKGNVNEAMVAEPKETDTGESVVGVARRVTLFFSNQSNVPVTIKDMTVNGDGNVTTEITSDDCKKVGKIPAFTRCAVVLSIVPSSPGPWSVEILVTHDGLGRIARAQINGTTLGERKEANEKKMGLALNNQKIEPIDFGEVEIGVGHPVRSALVYNDSNEDITILSIDLIAATNGLVRLAQGCEVDMTLRPGESCPITLQWIPGERGAISTDMIVRHSGRLGFMVMQIRGKTSGDSDGVVSEKDGKTSGSTGSSAGNASVPPPPSATDLGNLASSIPAISSAAIGASVAASYGGSDVFLIGSGGSRAILQRGNGITKVITVGSEADVGGVMVKVVSLEPRSAKLEFNGQQQTIALSSSPYRPAAAGNSKSDDKETKTSSSTTSAPAATATSSSSGKKDSW